jgi:hypothetical protein
MLFHDDLQTIGPSGSATLGPICALSADRGLRVGVSRRSSRARTRLLVGWRCDVALMHRAWPGANVLWTALAHVGRAEPLGGPAMVERCRHDLISSMRQAGLALIQLADEGQIARIDNGDR